MKYFSILAIFSLGLFSLSSTAFAGGEPLRRSFDSTRLSLEQLELDTDFEGGCGCSVGTGRGNNFRTLVFSQLELKAPALVKVDGSLRQLLWVSSTEKDGRPRVGDRFVKVYSDGELRLTLQHRTTFVCAENDEGCEVTRYRVNATLEKDRQRIVMKNLYGDCGC